jgi:tRNA A37 N6-isopentenylltransferase MiaA
MRAKRGSLAVGEDRPPSARDVQIRAIEARVDRFLAAGWVEEVRGLLGSGLPEGANCWKALGYRAVRRLARGEIGEREARETIVRETRQYAKRQMTWFAASGRLLVRAHRRARLADDRRSCGRAAERGARSPVRKWSVRRSR